MAGLVFYNLFEDFNFKLPPQKTPEQKAEEIRLRKERDAREDAIVRLWTQAASELRVRHPDPRVNVDLVVKKSYDQMDIRFKMENLRDTTDPDVNFTAGRGFSHLLRFPVQWPGYEVARVYLTAGWTLYMIHEGLELVTFKSNTWPFEKNRLYRNTIRERPVVDAHDDYGAHQKAISTGLENIASTLDWVLGLGNGQKMVEAHAERAAKELAAELDPWQPGT